MLRLKRIDQLCKLAGFFFVCNWISGSFNIRFHLNWTESVRCQSSWRLNARCIGSFWLISLIKIEIGAHQLCKWSVGFDLINAALNTKWILEWQIQCLTLDWVNPAFDVRLIKSNNPSVTFQLSQVVVRLINRIVRYRNQVLN